MKYLLNENLEGPDFKLIKDKLDPFDKIIHKTFKSNINTNINKKYDWNTNKPIKFENKIKKGLNKFVMSLIIFRTLLEDCF